MDRVCPATDYWATASQKYRIQQVCSLGWQSDSTDLIQAWVFQSRASLVDGIATPTVSPKLLPGHSIPAKRDKTWDENRPNVESIDEDSESESKTKFDDSFQASAA